ncbi:MAG: substrate-binding domain-containing protein [Capsulimonadales bacterium]|nr:substrate-binding domain-containing protein [Capsulimonadales bacterium]
MFFHTGAVCFVSGLPDNSGRTPIIKGLTEQLGSFAPLLHPSPRLDQGETDFVRQEHDLLRMCADDPEIAAVVVMPYNPVLNRSAFEYLLRSGKPVVILLRDLNGDLAETSYDFVGVDDFNSARRITQHLIDLGHRHIAHVTTWEPVFNVRERERGYTEALESAGLLRHKWVLPHENDEIGRILISEEWLRHLLAQPDRPTAIFALHDWAALNVLLTAHLIGLCIPRDLAVAGFDGIARFRQGPPLLTTAVQPFEEIGRQAATLLQERLRGKATGVKRLYYLEAPLHIHESTDPSRGDTAGSDLLVQDGAWRSHLIDTWMRLHYAEEIRLHDLAAVVNVSPRRLLEDFQQYQGKSPMQALQDERLLRVRGALLHPGSKTTVASVASNGGFSHLGRFAVLYRQRFGESPSDTLRRARTPDSAAF